MDISVYHVTDLANAKKILIEGFINPGSKSVGRIHFCKVRFLELWLKILKKERKKNVVLRVTIPLDFYHQEFYDWDLDEYSGGPPGEVTYGEGKYGWNAPIKRPRLQPNINCVIEIYKR